MSTHHEKADLCKLNESEKPQKAPNLLADNSWLSGLLNYGEMNFHPLKVPGLQNFVLAILANTALLILFFCCLGRGKYDVHFPLASRKREPRGEGQSHRFYILFLSAPLGLSCHSFLTLKDLSCPISKPQA